MGLALVLGPAKAGKIAHLLDGYLAELERDPVLIVPNRADVDRVERDLLRRVGALLAGSIGTFDDLFRELAREAADARPVAGETQRTLIARRALARTPLAAARPLGAVRRLLRCPARGARGARGGTARCAFAPGGAGRRRSRAALLLLSRGARRGRSLGPRPAPPPCRRAARLGARRLGRPSRVRVRIRGPDGRGVGAARSALCAHRGHRLAALRARPRCVRLVAANAGGPGLAGQGRDRGAAREVGRVCPGRPCAPGAPPLRRRAATGSARARRFDPLLRGRRRPRRARARRRRGAGARCGRHPARGDRADRPLGGAMACARRDGARDARDPVRRRRAAPARPDAVRPGAARSAPLRLAAGRATRSVRAICAPRSPGSRARTSTSSRVACAGGPSPPARRSRRRRSGCATGSRCRRSSCCGRPRGPSRRFAHWRAHAASRTRSGGAAGGRGFARRPASVRRGRPAARRARRLDRPRR